MGDRVQNTRDRVGCKGQGTSDRVGEEAAQHALVFAV